MNIKKLVSISLFLVFTSIPALTLTQPVEASVSNWQNGATFFPKSTTMYSSDSFKLSVDHLADTGANYAGLMIPYYQSNPYAHDIAPGWNTPTDASLREGIDYIHSKGMRVFLVMKLDNLDGQWHAYIQPTNRDAWFTNFGNLLNKYALIAQEKNVELYSLGVELWGVTSEVANYDNKARWEVLIANVRQRYNGLITYGAQHSGGYSEKDQVSFWKDMDFIGLSAYFPLNNTGPTPEEALLNSWQNVNNNEIVQLYNTFQKPILFTELGYRSITNSHLEPWSYWSNSSIDLEEQARNYEALFKYWDQFDYMKGWHVWAWEGDPNAGGANDDSFTPQNKPAQEVLRKWWSGSTPDDPTPPPDNTDTGGDTNTDPSSENTLNILPNPSVVSQQIGISGTIVNSTDLTSRNMIVFIFNSNWQKVKQKDYVGTVIQPDGSFEFSMDWTPENEGTYYVAVGLFDNYWQKVQWHDFTEPLIDIVSASDQTPPTDNNDQDPEVPADNNNPPDTDPNDQPTDPDQPTDQNQPPTDQPEGDIPNLPDYDQKGFSSLSRFPSISSAVGSPVKVESYFKSRELLTNVNVDIEIFNSNWKKVHQTYFKEQSFTPDTVNDYSFEWTPSQPGKYHIKVGIFSASWQNLYWYSQDNAIIDIL